MDEQTAETPQPVGPEQTETTAITPESTVPEPGTPPQETPASPPVETQEPAGPGPGGIGPSDQPQPSGSPAQAPLATPTDMPPPPGPQTQPTGTRTDAPSFLAPRTEGGARMQEGASAWLPDGTPIDNVGIVRATIKNPQTGQDQEVTAAATNPDTVVTGAAGQTMTAHEIGARGVTRTLAPQPQQVQQQPYTLIERYLQSAVHRTFGNVIGRSPTDLGLVGKGHVVVGHMILMDAESGELVRVLPGTRIDEDKVFVNTRNLPEWLVENPNLAKSAAGAST